MEPYELHQQALIESLAEVMRAERNLARLDAQKKRFALVLKRLTAKHESAMALAWVKIESLLAETGEPETTLPGAANDYKISKPEGVEVVDCPDVEAVPEEWVKTEKSVKKKELLEHLKGLRDANRALPNWASIKRNPASWGWKPIKKQTKE